MRQQAPVIVCILVCFYSNVARSGVAQVNFAVTTTIVATCQVAATGLTFSAYTGSTSMTQQSTITATCNFGWPFNIGLNAGVGTGSNVTNRIMMNGVNVLRYQMFSNSTLTTNWGNTVGTDTLSSTGTGSAQSFTVYGNIPVNQFVAPGSYTDTVTVTLTY